MGDRYEEKADTIVKEWAAAQDEGLTQLQQRVAAALREQGRIRAILEARVTMLNEAHRELNGALRSASIIAERQGKDTNWPGFRETIRYSLEMSHLIINTIPPPPDTGRDTVTPRDTGGGDGLLG